MLKSQIDSATLVLAVIAVTLGLTVVPGGFATLASLGGLSLVFVLLAYDRDGYRSGLQSAAYSAVFALSVTLAAAIVLKLIALSYGEAHPETDEFATKWLPALWGFVAVIFWPIDRARMSARLQFGTDATALPERGPIITPHFNVPPPRPAAGTMFAQPQRQPEAAPPPPPPPRPVEPPPVSELTAVYTPPPPQPQPAPQVSYQPPQPPQAPPAPAVSYQPPPPVSYQPPPPQPQPAPQVSYQPQPVPAATQMFAPPEPAPAPFPGVVPVTGRETMIYVTLVGEGLNVLRSVRAEHLGRDYYRIIDTVPEGEIWEYGPGQVVRCKKKNLSSGKAMVAFEEAQRVQ